MNIRACLLISWIALSAVGCAAPDSRTASEPKGDLGHLPVEPVRQAVELWIDPDATDYRGSVKIDLEIGAETDRFRFHAEEMAFDSVALIGSRGPAELTTEEGEDGLITAIASEPLAPGSYTLAIEFSNEYDTRAVGLYRMEQEGKGFLFSQMEAVDARKAFPCWDEPSYKIPYQLTLRAPELHTVVTNTPLVSATVEDGWKTHVFAESKPMPSYLIAIAAGRLDSIPIEGLSVPGRIYAVEGQSGLARIAAEMTPPILQALERYFERPYPYEKLDFVAVPEFWPGAMENPGLVTYADSLLLVDPAAASIGQRRTIAAVTAHELAHMWFGDLVTMKWWDDLWLNESFASWLGDRVTRELFPEYRLDLSSVRGTHGAMIADARRSTKPVRKPVESPAQIMEDLGLAYTKGQAVLEMTEAWIGPEKFRRGVIDYVEANAWGNAEAADLWSALSQASGQDVARMLAGFIEQPGVPLLTLELEGGTAVVSQRRFANHGGEVPAAAWTVPVTLRYAAGGEIRSKTFLLDEPSMRIELDEGVSWIVPNIEASGYFRWQLPKEQLVALAEDAEQRMTPRERIAFLGNARALLNAGAINGGDYLELLAGFAGDSDPEVVSAVVSGIGGVKGAFVPDEQLPAFGRYVRQMLRPALDRFGLERREGEDETVSLFRPRLIGWLGAEGAVETVRRYAHRLAEDYMKDPRSVDPALAGTALYVAGISGDRVLHERYRQHFERAASPVERGRFLGVLGSFPDEQIQDEALRYALNGPIRPTEMFSIAGSLPSTDASGEKIYRWVTENYETIAAKMPPDFRSFLVNVGGGCSEERLEQARAFFTDPSRIVDGTEAQLEKLTERVRDCVSLREREGPAVAAYLERLGDS